MAKQVIRDELNKPLGRAVLAFKTRLFWHLRRQDYFGIIEDNTVPLSWDMTAHSSYLQQLSISDAHCIRLSAL